jgi:hypothetical protein
MRIGGKVPKRRVHSAQRPKSHTSARRAATSDRHRGPPSWPERAPNALWAIGSGPLGCGAQDNARRGLAGGHHAPQPNEQLSRQRHDQGLARVEGLEAADPRHGPLDPEVVALDPLLQVLGHVVDRGARQEPGFPGFCNSRRVETGPICADPVGRLR